MIIIGILFLAASCSLLLNDRIENYIGASIISITVLTYFFAVIGYIKIGFYISIVICVMACFFVIYVLVREKGKRLFYIFTPGLLFFGVLAFALFVLNMNVDAAGSPDSMYWVKIVKGIYHYDDFWKGYYKRSHPQFIAIWGYLSMKTWPTWSDMVLVATNNIYKISLLIPFFSVISGLKFEKKSQNELFVRNVLLATIIAIFPYISDADEYSIYATDLIMGILVGMGAVFLVRALSEKRRSFFYVALLYFCGATLMKRIAIVILAMLMIWIFYVLISEKEIKMTVLYLISPGLVYCIGAGSIKYAMTLLGALAIALLLRYLALKKSPILNVVVAMGAAVVAVSVTWLVLKRAVEKYTSFSQLSVAKAYFRMIFTTNEETYYVGEMIHLPIMGFLLLVTGLFLALYLRKKYAVNKCECFLFVGLMVTTMLYLTLMCYLYITQIASASGQLYRESLLGSSRYMKIIPMMIGCYLIYLLITRYNGAKAILIMLLCVTMFSNLFTFSKFVFLKEEKISFPEMELAGVSLTAEDNIAYIDMGIRDYYRSFILNCFPYQVTNIDALSYTYREANDMKYVSQEELKILLQDCNYLYIKNADEEFASRYKDLFADESEIRTERALYSIDENTGCANLLYSNMNRSK